MERADQFDIPDAIVTSWKQAVESKSRATKNAAFQAFLKAGKDWSKLLGRLMIASMNAMFISNVIIDGS